MYASNKTVRLSGYSMNFALRTDNEPNESAMLANLKACNYRHRHYMSCRPECPAPGTNSDELRQKSSVNGWGYMITRRTAMWQSDVNEQVRFSYRNFLTTLAPRPGQSKPIRPHAPRGCRRPHTPIDPAVTAPPLPCDRLSPTATTAWHAVDICLIEDLVYFLAVCGATHRQTVRKVPTTDAAVDRTRVVNWHDATRYRIFIAGCYVAVRLNIQCICRETGIGRSKGGTYVYACETVLAQPKTCENVRRLLKNSFILPKITRPTRSMWGLVGD